MSDATPRSPRSRRLVQVRPVTTADFPAIIALCERTYPGSPPWMVPLLTGHLEIFPEGQLVAMDQEGMLLGYAASLIIYWDDYEMDSSWCDFTSRGTFKNHDPALGRTLYGAEVMVHPEIRGSGVGGKMYDARFELAKRFGILRIRAGARLRGYHKHAGRLTAQEYVQRVVRGSAARPDSLLPDQPRLPRARGGVGLPQEGP